MQAVLYAAKSTKDPRGSIPAQLADGRERADREDWVIACIDGKLAEYADENATAWKGDRGPELVRAMENAEQIGAILIVQHSDRLARGDAKRARHLVEIALWSIKTGVIIHSIQDPSTFENLAMAAMMGDRNEADSRRKSDAVKRGMKERASKGLLAGGIRPYGYRWAEDRSGLIVVSAEAEVVLNRIYRAFRGGTTQMQIVRDLKAAGITTVRGRHWHQGTIGQMLANPLYKGVIRHDGEEYAGKHDAIVPLDLWTEVAELRAARAKSGGKGRGRPPKGRHLFRRGMLRCECGEALVPRTQSNRSSDPYEIYLCYGRHQDIESCSMKPLRRADIDSAVLRYFEQVGLDLEATRDQLADARKHKLTEVRALREQADGETRRAEERLLRVRRDYTDGKITAEDWSELREDLSSELEAARAEVERLIDQEAEVETWGEFEDAERDTFAKLAELRRAIAGEVSDAAGIDGIRAALSRLFKGFVIRYPHSGRRMSVELSTGTLLIEPVVREQAVEGYSALRPIFRREPLYRAENKYVKGFTR